MSQKKSEKKSTTFSQSCNTSTSSASKASVQVGADIGSLQSMQKRPKLSDVNVGLTCNLCKGYFIDATTISECLHSFCKSCIVRHLEIYKCCPICEAQVHGTKPLLSIRSDKILQDIVYKLIPDVFKNEMKRRRDFYGRHPEAAPTCAEDRGEIVDHRIFYMANDQISLSLEYGYGENQIPENGFQSSGSTQQSDESSEAEGMKRYLLCPAGLSIVTLKKFIARKYGLPTTYKVDIMYLEDILNEDYTLMDVAYIYAWRRSDPMRLFYRISERPIKRVKTSHPQTVDSKNGSGSGVNNNNSNNDLSDVNNKSNSNVVNSQSKLVQTQASSCTLRTTASTIIMTGAAPVPTLPSMKTQNPSNKSNNSGATGVTSGKASTATPRRADPSKSISVNTQPTPPGILKSKSTHMSASGVQTDEPPKKLRKILPNNSSVSTPKPVPTDFTKTNTSSPVIPLTPLTTSTSTVNSLRQCRINSDKSKLCSSFTSIGYNNSSQNVNQNIGLSASNSSIKSDTKSVSDISAKKNCNKKCSAFDVRTLIGTKSPTLHCNRHSVESMSGNQCIECNEEKTFKEKNSSSEYKSATQTSKQSKTSAREVHRNKLTSSQSSMPSTLPSMTTGSAQNKKVAMNSPSVETFRPPTNKSTAPNNRVATPDSSPSLDSMPSKQSKCVTNVSSKQLNAKSLKSSQNETSVKQSCNANRDMTTDNTNTKISIKAMTGAKSDTPQHHSTPLSPTSIRIKLPPPPQNTTQTNIKNSCKSSASNTKTTPSSTSMVSLNVKESNHSVESFVSKSDNKKQNLDNKTSETGHKSIGNPCNQSLSKSSISQSKTKGASINQIVSKIASGVTAKSASVNVTSTTPTLELKAKSNTNVPQLGLGSNEVTTNELNDNKVSTTTTDSVGSYIHKSESAIKSVSAVTSAATNSGNLVIRISTKNHSVESLVSPKEKEKKFEIKRDFAVNSTNNSSDNSTKTNNSSNSQIDSKSEDKNHKIESKASEDEEDDDDDIDGKLVVDVPNDDNCERDITNIKGSPEINSSTEEKNVISTDDNSSKSQSNALSVKPTKVSDISTKLAINISTTHQLSANSAVLASPPPTPTPSPKSESDTIVDSKGNSSSSSNGPLDLSMSTKKDRSERPSISPVPIRAIYDIPPPKPKHCVNPAVLDKHRGLFPTSNAPKQQYPSFKIMGSQSQGIRQSTVSSINTTSTAPNLDSSKKNRSIASPIVSSNTTTATNQSNSSRHRSLSNNNNHSHHHNSHHNHKTYSVITPDPHRYTPKLVIRNIGSPPSITSHFNYPTHH